MNVQAQMWLPVGNIDDIPKQGARCINFGANKLAIFRTENDDLFAMEDKCPHSGGPLSQGIVHGNCVTCPLHNWVISLESGEAQGADDGVTHTYPVKCENEQVFIGIGAQMENDEASHG